MPANGGMFKLEEWLKASPEKRVAQVEFTASGFRVVCVEQQGDKSGKEPARSSALTISDALNSAAVKLG